MSNQKLKADLHHSCIRKINARDIAINAKPAARKIPRLLSDVTPLNNNMQPNTPRSNVIVPPITKLKDVKTVNSSSDNETSGKKTPESNAKIAIK